MSGGHFDYAYSNVNTFNDVFELELENDGKPDKHGYTREKLSEPVKKKFQHILRFCKRASDYMREVEWFYSGDIGEDSFMKRVAEIEKEKLNEDF